MHADSLIQAFRHLPPGARRDVLSALIDQLTPYEWRELQTTLNTRSFQFDIIGSLPVELVVEIFDNLDFAAPFRLQRVSKRWSYVLRAPDLMRKRLKSWYGDALPSGDSSLESSYAFRQRQAEHILRLCTGRPFSSMRVTMSQVPWNSIFIGDVYAWTTERTLRVCNLNTGATWQAQTPARERIQDIAASEEIIAFTSTNTCYIKPLVGGQIKQFRLLNAMSESIGCRGRTVACGGIVQDHAVIYVWDYDSNRGQSFDIPLTEKPFADIEIRKNLSLALLPQPQTSTIAVFCSNTGEWATVNGSDPRLFVYYSIFSLDGQRVLDGERFFGYLGTLSLSDIRPIGPKGRYAIEAWSHIHDGEINANLSVRFVFDEASNTFVDDPFSRHLTTPKDVAQWRSAYYQMGQGVTMDSLSIADGAGTAMRLPEPAMQQETYSNMAMANFDRRPFNPRCWIGENFVIVLSGYMSNDSELDIYCFDKDVTLPYDTLYALANSE